MKQDQTYLSRDDLLSLLDALKAGGFAVLDHRCTGRDVGYTDERKGVVASNPVGLIEISE